jgi:hypothetical protein
VGHRRSHCVASRGPALGLALLFAAAVPAIPAAAPVARPQEQATAEVRRIAAWVHDSKDNHRRPYIIVDKANARVFVFDAAGTMQGTEPALLGLGRGDTARAVPGERPGPQDRITPAGRFLANLDHDAHGEPILLIDYEHAIALHPVVKGTVDEHRAERLASATSADNRISFGCINVPLAFFRNVVSVAFAHTDGYVYILPESGASTPLFGASVAPD